MSDASMITLFNNKVSAFNKAVKSNDVDSICELGEEMIQIALNECSKPNVPPSLKNTYSKQCVAVARHMARCAKNPSAVVSQASGDDADGNDPYYKKRNWFSDEVPNLNFTNIIGIQEVKDAFMVDIVAPLRSEFKEAYHKFRGDQLGTNILLYGLPGVGKTFVIKCLAGALNCRIAIVQASEVLGSVVGVAEKNMRDIFQEAEEIDGNVLIFIDEIDSLCSDRTSDDSRYTKSVLTTMLTCMDGFNKTTKPGQLRIIVAATNLPWKLDPALKRGGRFETQIYVPLPDFDDRIHFVELDLNRVPHDNDVTSDYLAEKLDGYAGADIRAIMKQIVNEPLRREIMNIMGTGHESGERVTVADCEKVLGSYINGITPEMLLRFKAYQMGVSYEDLKEQLKGANNQ